MKKQYTKKQIAEAIAYWKKQLKSMNESTTYVQPKNGKDFLVNDLMQFAQTVKDAGEYDDLVCGLVSTDDEDFGSTGNFIGGYVNSVEKSNGICVLTLAPYRSGSRRRDISVNSANPISFDQIVSQSIAIGLGAKVAVKMKDPFGIGPNADAVMLAPVIAGKVTSSSYNGVFLLISYDRMQPIDQTLAENKKYSKKQLKKMDESTSQEIPKELFKECIAVDWPSVDSMDIDAMILSTREDYNQFIDAATVPQKLRAKINAMWSLGYDYIIYYYNGEDDGALEEAMDKMMKENPKYGLLEYTKDYVEQHLETVYVIGLKWRRA